MQLSDDVMDPVVKRLRRAQGQLNGVLRMIDEGKDCREVLTQLSACSKALDRAGFALISAGMQHCMVDTNENKDEDMAAMEKLFMSLA